MFYSTVETKGFRDPIISTKNKQKQNIKKGSPLIGLGQNVGIVTCLGKRFLNSLLLGLYTCTMIIDALLYFSRYFTVEKYPLIKDSICLISLKCFSNMTRCFFIIYFIFFLYLNLLITLSTPYGIFLLVLTYMQ